MQAPGRDGPTSPRSGPEIGVAVITWRARDLLPRCLAPLLDSPVRPRLLVVNSGSDDGTVEVAAALGAETWVVSRAEFNHGATREAARHRLGTPIVVMMTPDAHPQSPRFLETLTAPVRDGRAAVAYARQVASPTADPIARFGRAFNYPLTSQLRDRGERDRYGSYLHFCSNACAAWSSTALDRIGGFPTTLVSEETLAAAQLLRAGFKVAYVAAAVVEHSHPTRLADSFRRQFDIGYTRQLFADLLLAEGGDASRGRAYLQALLEWLAIEQPSALPYALLDTALRYLGYRAGRLATRLPDALARQLSGQDFYWRSGVRVARPGLAARTTTAKVEPA